MVSPVKSVTLTLYIVAAIHILVIGFNAYYVKNLTDQSRLDASVINLAGKVRGGIQATMGQFAFGVNFEDSADRVSAALETLLSPEYDRFLGSGMAFVDSIKGTWTEIELQMLECDAARYRCLEDLSQEAEELWFQTDTVVDYLQREADRKLNQLNHLYWILGLELILITAIIGYIYFTIHRRLEAEHADNLSYVDLIDRHVITSKTDVDGKITYASTAFAQISGFRKDELIGRNHRVVRHPDMPDSLYQDLWGTISSGESWEGEIKNKKKDGTHYWVRAFISPQCENGEIVGYTAVRKDITDQKRVEELSTTDALTGLSNRLKLDHLLEVECQRMDRYGRPVSVIILDLDHFKSVNDTYGHLTGDQVLIEIAEVLQSNSRDTDHVGRWGGEEFVVICPETDGSGAQALAEKIRKRVEKTKFSVVGHKTASFGVAARLTKENPERMMGRADVALYAAKENGRNQVVLSGADDSDGDGDGDG
ncbi:MAG: sensor domain-containing diguanylate cyclase [Rhodospirillaceae bacterium]